MTNDLIRKYLDAFYDGTSTPAQEEALRNYFLSTTDVDDAFRADAAMFCAMAQEISVPDNLKDRILDATVRRRRVHHWPIASSIAAAAAIALIIITAPPEQTSNYREVTDPAEAQAITMEIASTLQKSVNKLEIINNLPI